MNSAIFPFENSQIRRYILLAEPPLHIFPNCLQVPGFLCNSCDSDLGHPVQYLTLAFTLTDAAKSTPSPPGLDSWLISTLF